MENNFTFKRPANIYGWRCTYSRLEGTTRGKRPEYLKIFDYILNNKKDSYTKDELMKATNYGMIGNELFACFNRNKIISYAPGIGWVRGENFDNWRRVYYKESFIEKVKVDIKDSKALTADQITYIKLGSLELQVDLSYKVKIKEKLEQIEQLIAEIKEIL